MVKNGTGRVDDVGSSEEEVILVRGLLVWILKNINEAIKRDTKSVFKYDRK